VLVLIDESGDPGFKFKRGSSSHFIVAMVVFSSLGEAEKCSAAIRALQQKLEIFPEFKFSNCRAEVRGGFFMCVRQFDFSINNAALIISSTDRN